MVVTTEIDDLRLVWPAEVFVAEAQDLLRAGYASETEAVRLLFEEAFADGVGSRLVDEVSALRGYRGRWKPGIQLQPGPLVVIMSPELAPRMEPICRLLLSEVSSRADRGDVAEYAPARYWTARRSPGSHQAPSLTHSELCRGFMELLQELEDADYLQPVAAYDCNAEQGRRSVIGTTMLSRLLGRRTVWPLDDPDVLLEPDELYDLIEVFYDLVARPRTGQWHDWCKEIHYDEHDRRAGQRVYLWKVNELLQRGDVLLRLSANAPDHGRLIEISGDARDELERAALEREGDGAAEQRVTHAIGLHRRRHSTRADKRDAVKALGDALEPQREVIRKLLSKSDESDLFEILNRFDIRHLNRKQSGDYAEEFLDYLYWTLLATTELIARLRITATETGGG